MSAALQKVSIDELQVGMFIVEMDISWIKSPFLLHRRAIKSKNDIILLKKSGARLLTVDLDKSHIEVKQQTAPPIVEQAACVVDPGRKIKAEDNEFSAEQLDNPSVPLNEELNRAVVLKEKALEAFQDMNELVKNNEPIPIQEFTPIIDDTLTSLIRNSQALLTLMHLKRSEEKLFSHSFSVMTLALTFAIKDGVAKEDLKILGLAAVLHDIGWAQLPLNLFGKAKQYSVNELKVVQQHQKISALIINRSDGISSAVKTVMMNHHERLDGSGYPNQLQAEQLDKLSNILIITDFYDELVHGLLDQPGLIPSEALRFQYKEAVQNKLKKSQVEQLIRLLGIYPLTSAVELTSGEKGIVVEVNRDKPLFPVVDVMYTTEGNALTQPIQIDLEKDQKKRHIKGIINLSDKQNDPQNLLIVNSI